MLAREIRRLTDVIESDTNVVLFINVQYQIHLTAKTTFYYTEYLTKMISSREYKLLSLIYAHFTVLYTKQIYAFESLSLPNTDLTLSFAKNHNECFDQYAYFFWITKLKVDVL